MRAVAPSPPRCKNTQKSPGARVAGLSPAQLCAIIEAQAGASDAALRVAEEHAARLVEQPYFFFIWRSTP